MKDDDWNFWPVKNLPTRHGGNIGRSAENRMLQAVGGQDGIRTRIQHNNDGSTTTLRTRGGSPHFETKKGGVEITQKFEKEELLLYCRLCSEEYMLGVSLNKDGSIVGNQQPDTFPSKPVSVGKIKKQNLAAESVKVNIAAHPQHTEDVGDTTWRDTREKPKFKHTLSWVSINSNNISGGGTPVGLMARLKQSEDGIPDYPSVVYKPIYVSEKKLGTGNFVEKMQSVRHQFYGTAWAGVEYGGTFKWKGISPLAKSTLFRDFEPTKIKLPIVAACSFYDEENSRELYRVIYVDENSAPTFLKLGVFKTDGTKLHDITITDVIDSMDGNFDPAFVWNSSGTIATGFFSFYACGNDGYGDDDGLVNIDGAGLVTKHPPVGNYSRSLQGSGGSYSESMHTDILLAMGYVGDELRILYESSEKSLTINETLTRETGERRTGGTYTYNRAETLSKKILLWPENRVVFEYDDEVTSAVRNLTTLRIANTPGDPGEPNNSDDNITYIDEKIKSIGSSHSTYTGSRDLYGLACDFKNDVFFFLVCDYNPAVESEGSHTYREEYDYTVVGVNNPSPPGPYPPQIYESTGTATTTTSGTKGDLFLCGKNIPTTNLTSFSMGEGSTSSSQWYPNAGNSLALPNEPNYYANEEESWSAFYDSFGKNWNNEYLLTLFASCVDDLVVVSAMHGKGYDQETSIWLKDVLTAENFETINKIIKLDRKKESVVVKDLELPTFPGRFRLFVMPQLVKRKS